MAFVPLFDPTQQFMGRSSKLLVGGNLYVYRNGTDDLATVKNIAGTTISQPVVLDCDGRAQGGVCVSSSGKYRLEVKDAYDALQWSITGMSAIGGGEGGGSDVSITPSYNSGLKIADYSIDGESGELFAPTGGGGSYKQCALILEVSGSTSSDQGIIWDGSISQGVTFSQSYRNVEEGEIVPSIQTNENNVLKLALPSYMTFLKLDVSVFVNSFSGFALTDRARWGYDSNAIQLIGGFSRTFIYDDDATVLSNGFTLPGASDITATFKVLGIASFIIPT